MGCQQSSTKEVATRAQSKDKDKDAATPSSSASKEARLLEEYSVGQTLGEGAFGVVSNCRKRATGEEYAVKMVDKVETPVESIKKEAELMQRMDHANIVKCHGVFYERCFVCIVMDKYAGGDLVEGLQRHLKDKGQINCHEVVHTAQQMGSSIQYLHHKNVIHRDIKGDNYLMDRKDMSDPKCHIVLTDFGTCCTIAPGERLHAGVGTKIFWPPEFFDKDYGPKVDVWALGVIMYGLVSGRFPFRDENDIRTKDIKIPKRVHPMCEEFIKKMLDKIEQNRPSSDTLMSHPWVASTGNRAEQGADGSAAEEAEASQNTDIFRDDANDGIKERRQELMNRMNKEQNLREKPTKQSAVASCHLQKEFILTDKQVPGARLKYEWWCDTKVKSTGILDMEGTVKPGKDAEGGTASDIQMFSQMLTDHNLDVKLFGVGKAKTVEQLAKEVHSGAARLMLDATKHKKLVRVVDVVLLRIHALTAGNSEPPRLLIETEEMFPDGRKRETLRLPGTKKEPHENTRQLAERVIKDMLNLNVESIRLDLNQISRHEEETESPSYPGVQTVYRKEILECSFVATDASLLSKAGLPAFTSWHSKDQVGNTKTWSWLSEKDAESKGVKLKASEAEAISTLVRAPIGLSEESLRQYLTGVGVDIARFGKDGAKSIKDFSAELIKGESCLTQDGSAKPSRVVDVVVMIIKNPSDSSILVQAEQVLPDKQTIQLNRLPGAKRRPDENQFLSARRILRRQLEIDENMVKLLTDVEFVEEEKTSAVYPGLVTVYRKRLIKAELTTTI